MAQAIQTAARFRYPISGEDLGRVMMDAAHHLGNGSLERKLSEIPGVQDVQYTATGGEGVVYFTVATEALPKAPQRVTTMIDTHLKDLTHERMDAAYHNT